MQKLNFKNGLYIENWNTKDYVLDGGGSTQYTDFLNPLLYENKTYDRALEWCSGLGSIGFSLLDAKLVNHITFMDSYQPAIDYVHSMADLNNISDKVSGYCKSQIKDLPLHEKFDLILANPPHRPHEVTIEEAHAEDYRNGYKPRDKSQLDDINRILVDVDWQIHQEFFTNIKNYCNAGCDILISTTGNFINNIEYAEKGGLRLIKSISSPELQKDAKATQTQITWFRYEG